MNFSSAVFLTEILVRSSCSVLVIVVDADGCEMTGLLLVIPVVMKRR